MGTATMRPIAVVHSVPVTSGRTPKLFSAKVGAQRVPPRNSPRLTWRKKSNAGTSSATTMPIVMNTDKAPDRPRKAMTARSPYRGDRRVNEAPAVGRPEPGVVDGPRLALVMVTAGEFRSGDEPGTVGVS